MSVSKITLRVRHNLHGSWSRDARSQGLSLNAYLTSCVQNCRLRLDKAIDPIQIEMLERQLADVQEAITTVTASLDSVLDIVEKRAYDNVDLLRAKEALLTILLQPANIDDVKQITSVDDLKDYVVRKNSLLERYLVASSDNPLSLLDEILFELEGLEMISVTGDGQITWGVRLWEEKANIMDMISHQ